MSGEHEAPPQSLLDLHDALARDRFAAGPGELLAASRLLTRLVDSGRLPDDAEGLEPLLRAVYCKSPHEQNRFGAVFRRWREQAPTEGRGGPGPDPEQPLDPKAPLEPAPQPGPGVLGMVVRVAIGLAFAALVVLRVFEALLSPTPHPVQPSPSAAPAAVTGQAKAAASPAATDVPVAPSAAAERQGIAGYVPQQRLQSEFRPWLVGLLLALPLPLLLFLFAPALALSRRHADRARSGSGIRLDISSWREEADRIVPPMKDVTAALLDRHVRPGFDESPGIGRRALDVRRTLAATLRRHGAMSLRWERRRARPSYLMLIDLRDEHDLRGRLFFRWADRLRKSGVGVEVWLYDGDPRTLYPADQRRVFDTAGRARNGVPFHQVADRAASEPVRRLVIVSDGQGFFRTGDDHPAEWWVRLGWRRWRERVLFTPIDPRDWGRRELAIERPMGRGDPGFLVLPLEQEALDAYAVQLTSGELPPIVLAGARRYPSLLEERPGLAMSADAPSPGDLDKLMAQLRVYLGENGLRWLAACAVPPLTRWELTLLIGQALFRDMGSADEDDLRWLMASNYPRLARLPWLRQSYLPDWLTLRLLGELSLPVQDRVREVVRHLLESVPTDHAPVGDDVLMLDCTPPSAAAGARLGAAEGEASEASEARRRRDWLYLGFLDGLSSRQLAMRAPVAWQQWFGQPLRAARRRSGREWAALALEWVRAFAVRLMWRDGRAASGPSPLPLILAAAWVIATAGGLQWLAGHAAGIDSSRLVKALMSEEPLDTGVRSETELTSFGFSADGRLFFTIDDDGELQVRDEWGRAAAPPLNVGTPEIAHLEAGGTRLVTVEASKLRRWDVRHGRPMSVLGRLDGREGWRDALASRDGRWLALTSARGEQLALVDLRDGSVRARAIPGKGEAVVLAFPEGKASLVALRGRTMTELRLDALTQDFGASYWDESVTKTWLSPDGQTLAGLSGNTLQLGAALGHSPPGTPALDLLAEPTLVALGNGALLAVATEAAPDMLTVWNADSGLSVGTVRSRQGRFQEAQFIDGGRVLLVRDEGEAVAVYDTSGGAGPALLPLGQPLKHRSPVQKLVVAPAGSALLTATRGSTGMETLRLWQPPELQADTLQDAGGGWSVVALSPDGRRAAAGNALGDVIVWGAASGRPIVRFKAHEQGVSALAFGPDGSTLLSACPDGSLRLSDSGDGRLLASEQAGSGLRAISAGSALLTLGADEVQVWRRAGAGWTSLRIQERDLVAASLNPDGNQVLTAGAGGTLHFWQPDGSPSQELRPLDDTVVESPPPAPGPQPVPNVVGLPLQAAKARLLTAGFAVQWSAETRDATDATVDAMAPHPGPVIAAGSVVNLTTRRGSTTATPGGKADGVQGRAPGESRAASACQDGYVERQAFAGDEVCVTPAVRARVIDDNAARQQRIDQKSQAYGPETCQQGYVWREADRYLRGDAFEDRACVPPAERAQAAEDNEEKDARAPAKNTAHVWYDRSGRPHTGSPGATQAEPPPPVLLSWIERPAAPASMARGPDRLENASFEDHGRLVLARGALYARLFNAETLQPVGQTALHKGLVAALYWPRGGMILTGGRDGLVRFWEPNSGRESLPPLRHGASLARLGLGPDGHLLATVDAESNALVWDLDARRALPGAGLRAGGSTGALAFDGAGHRLLVATPEGQRRSVRLPASEPGSVRTVRTHATFWLVALLGCSVATFYGVALAMRRRARDLRRLAGDGEAAMATTVSA